MSAEDTTSEPVPGDVAAAGTALPQLERIAAVLGCPVEVFFGGVEADSETSQTAELIRLWLGLRDPALRLGILAYLRDAVERQGR